MICDNAPRVIELALSCKDPGPDPRALGDDRPAVLTEPDSAAPESPG